MPEHQLPELNLGITDRQCTNLQQGYSIAKLIQEDNIQ